MEATAAADADRFRPRRFFERGIDKKRDLQSGLLRGLCGSGQLFLGRGWRRLQPAACTGRTSAALRSPAHFAN